MSARQHVSAAMLPIVVALLMPYILLTFAPSLGYGLDILPLRLISFYSGILLMACGLTLLAVTNWLFVRIGRGTLAPWAPTRYLVVSGVYRFMRNPMIAGVLLILLGESLFFDSFPLLLWFLVFLVGNHIYFVKSEEPGLVERFGESYVEYMANVPRWLPRRTPWIPELARAS